MYFPIPIPKCSCLDENLTNPGFSNVLDSPLNVFIFREDLGKHVNYLNTRKHKRNGTCITFCDLMRCLSPKFRDATHKI